jgi:hypothetical protein
VTVRRRIHLACVAALLATVPMATAGPAHGDDTCTSYTAAAAADGVRVSYDSPGFLVVEHLDLGAPVAQVAVDAYGTSTGYAAYPDPSEEVLSLVPVAGLSRSVYPLFIESQYPGTPEARLNTPAVSMATNTAPHYARAVADSGAGIPSLLTAGLVRASAAADCADTGVVTAHAESTVDSLGLPGALSLLRVHSDAKVVVATDGTTQVTSDLELSLVTLAGTPVELTTDGLASGAAIPIPDLGLNQLLSGLGMQLTYLAAEPQPDGQGVTAPAVRLTVTQNLSGGAPTVVSATIGRAYASASGSAVDTTSGTDTFDSGSGGPFDGGTIDTSAGSLPELGTAPAVTRPPRANLGATVPVHAVGLFSMSSLYAVLVIGSLVVLAGGLLFKTLGVKVGWR